MLVRAGCDVAAKDRHGITGRERVVKYGSEARCQSANELLLARLRVFGEIWNSGKFASWSTRRALF